MGRLLLFSRRVNLKVEQITKWQTGLGVMLVVLGPLLPNHYRPWASFYGDAVTICGLGVLCLPWLATRAKAAWPVAALIFAALALVPPLQASAHLIIFWGDAWVASAYAALFALAIVAGAECCRRDVHDLFLRAVAGALVLSALASLLVALEQWLMLGQLGLYAIDMPPGGRPFGNLGQPNLLATWLMLGIVGLHLLFQFRVIGPWTLTAGIVFLSFGMAMTQSRAGWLEMLVLLGWLAMVRRRAGLRVARAAIATTGATFVVFVMTWPALCRFLYLEPGRTTGEQQFSAGLRLVHWRSLLDALSQQPLFGYGWNQVSVAQAAVAAHHPFTGELIEHSHDIALDLLVWNGIPLGLLVIAGVAWWFAVQIRRCIDARVAILLGAMGAVLVHGLLEYPLDYAYFLLPLGLMAGIVEHLSPVMPRVTLPRAASAAFAAGLTVLLVWIASDYLKVESNTRELRFEQAHIGVHKVPSQAPDIMLLTQQREFLRFARTQAARNMSPAQVDWMGEIASRFGYPPVLLRYALAAGLNHRPLQAADALARLCKMHPPARCKEGLDAWTGMARSRYPELAAVPLPPMP